MKKTKLCWDAGRYVAAKRRPRPNEHDAKGARDQHGRRQMEESGVHYGQGN